MAKRKNRATGSRIERAAVTTGRELGSLVSRLEKEADKAVSRGNKMQATARKRSVQLMRRAARSLQKLASQLEKAGS